ncbi:adhesion G-protein coupled receptor G2-like [Ciona intestinalis]
MAYRQANCFIICFCLATVLQVTGIATRTSVFNCTKQDDERTCCTNTDGNVTYLNFCFCRSEDFQHFEQNNSSDPRIRFNCPYCNCTSTGLCFKAECEGNEEAQCNGYINFTCPLTNPFFHTTPSTNLLTNPINVQTNQTGCSELKYGNNISLSSIINHALCTNLTTEKTEIIFKQTEEFLKSSRTDVETVIKVINFMRLVAKLAGENLVQVSLPILRSVANITSQLATYNLQNSSDNANILSPDRSRLLKNNIIKSLSSLTSLVALNKSNIFVLTDFLNIQVNNEDGANITSLYQPSGLDVTIPNSVAQYSFIPNITGNTGVKNTRRTSFISYSNFTLFDTDNHWNMAWILSIQIGLGASVENLVEPVRIGFTNFSYTRIPLFNLQKQALEIQLKCVFWDFNTSSWSDKGCCLNLSAGVSQCQCNHLTNFGLLVKSTPVAGDVAVSIISNVGCGLSIIGLIITVVVHSIGRELKKRRPARILCHICSNLAISLLLIAVGIPQTQVVILCSIIAVMLHYFMLVTWCWMTVYTYDMYMSLVQVFSQRGKSFMVRAACYAYITPAVIVSVSAGLSFGYFDTKRTNPLCSGADPIYESSYRAKNMCWLHGPVLNYAFLLPLGLMLLFNLIVFIVVLRELTWKQMKVVSSQKRTVKQMLTIAVTMSTILGISWVFGYFMLLSDDPIYMSVFNWLFAVTTTLQGFGIFLLTSVRHTEARDVWLKPIMEFLSRSHDTVVSQGTRRGTRSTLVPPTRLKSGQSQSQDTTRF